MMKKYILLLIFISGGFIANAQILKPYTIGFTSSEKAEVLQPKIVKALAEQNMEVLGEYQVKHIVDSWVIVFTSDELKEGVQLIGGLTGFAATLRIAITTEGSKSIVSYTTPNYWGNAYFRKDFEKVSDNYVKLSEKLKAALSTIGNYNGSQFGSENGLSVKDLRDYQYMFGMPNFDDTIELESFDSYKEAVAKIDASVKKGVDEVAQVFKIEYPEKELALYGFALIAEEGEKKFMPIIDISSPKHTAFLPYELLVLGDEVHILHGRYRIALSFPDLSMGTFTKIMSTPGYIEDTLEQLVK